MKKVYRVELDDDIKITKSGIKRNKKIQKDNQPSLFDDNEEEE